MPRTYQSNQRTFIYATNPSVMTPASPNEKQPPTLKWIFCFFHFSIYLFGDEKPIRFAFDLFVHITVEEDAR